MLQHILVGQKFKPAAASARSPYTNVTFLHGHDINGIAVLHFKLVWCSTTVTQGVPIKHKTNLAHFQTLPRTVRLHKFSQLSMFLNLEINNISVQALDLHTDKHRFCL